MYIFFFSCFNIILLNILPFSLPITIIGKSILDSNKSMVNGFGTNVSIIV